MFNENKYKACINRLILQKFGVIISSFFIFGIIGGGIAFPIMVSLSQKISTVIIGIIIGAIIGLIIGINNAWKIDMQIQESYWRIDVLSELKKQNPKTSQYSAQSTSNKKDYNNTPKSNGISRISRIENK